MSWQRVGPPARTASALGLLLRAFRPAEVPVVLAARPMVPGRADGTGLSEAADRVFELPWGGRSDDTIDLAAAQRILDEDHYGLADVKSRIVEFLAVRKLRAERDTNDEPAPDAELRAEDRRGHGAIVTLRRFGTLAEGGAFESHHLWLFTVAHGPASTGSSAR